MQSKPIYQYIYFGSSLRYLQDVRAGWVLRASVDAQEWYVLEILNHFLSWVPLLNLTVTDRAATNLNLFRQELGSRPPDHVLTEEEAAKLKGLIDSLRPTLDAEASGQVAFIVTDKRLQVTRLLGDVGALFALASLTPFLRRPSMILRRLASVWLSKGRPPPRSTY